MILNTPQKMIDDAVDKVFAEYDDRGVIETRVLADIEGEERLRPIELSFRGRLTEIDQVDQAAKSAAEAVGAKSWTAIVYVLEQGNELVFISANVAGQKTRCVLGIERSTGESVSDLVLIRHRNHDDGPVISFSAPTAWFGPIADLDIYRTAEILNFLRRGTSTPS